MNEALVYIVAGVAAVVLILLLRWYIRYEAYGKAEAQKKKQEEKRKAAASQGLLVTCPLCNSPLLPGEDLFTRVYRPMNVPDQLCTISGCPHCYPKPEPGVKRECPVCHKDVPLKDGHLNARLFNKTMGKKHVIVTGCTECSKGAR